MFKIKDSTRVFVCPTDTVYGISARAGDKEAIRRIKRIKGVEDAPNGFITLIAEIQDLEKFGIQINSRQKSFLSKVWPGKVTVAFKSGEFGAFRLPEYQELREFIQSVGPIVSTSLNKHTETPAKTVKEAKEIFGNEIDEYIDAGELKGEPSTIVKILR